MLPITVSRKPYICEVLVAQGTRKSIQFFWFLCDIWVPYENVDSGRMLATKMGQEPPLPLSEKGAGRTNEFPTFLSPSCLLRERPAINSRLLKWNCLAISSSTIQLVGITDDNKG
jgi:hypothetical protein